MANAPDILDPRGRPVTSLSYQAVQDKGRRQAPRAVLKNEDSQLTSSQQGKLDMTAQDLPRNFELAAWALRMHVAYVSRLRPHIATRDQTVNDVLAYLIANASRRKSFDIAGRHDRDNAMALFEIANVVYGDAAFIKLAGGKLQAIPGVRIAKPSGAAGVADGVGEKWGRLTDRGLILDPSTGAMLEACICRWGRSGIGLEFDHFEPAENLIYQGYFTDFDQTRGRSPLASAINRCTDLSEALEYTNLKVKLHALLGVAFGSDAATSVMEPSLDGDEATTSSRPKYKVDIDRGLMVFNLAPGDRVDTVESKVPTAEFVDYTQLSIRLALLAFDIPYTFLDSGKSSFSARIADSNQYEFLSESKRAKNAAVLTEWHEWQIMDRWAREEPLRSVLAAAGMSPEEAVAGIGWVGGETPWLDKLKQLQGDQLGVGLSIESIQRICRRRGVDWRQIVDENAEVMEYAKAKGVPIMIGQPGQADAGAASKSKPAVDADDDKEAPDAGTE